MCRALVLDIVFMLRIVLCLLILGHWVVIKPNFANETVTNKNGTVQRKPYPHVNCSKIERTNGENNTVLLVNSSVLSDYLTPLDNESESQSHNNGSGKCIVVFYYSTFCPFSMKAAADFNALARSFADIHFYAIDAYNDQIFNVIHGVTGTPHLNLFHNGKLVARYEFRGFDIDQFMYFLISSTNLLPKTVAAFRAAYKLLPSDYQGPIPPVLAAEIDYVLIFCWFFVIVCVLYHFGRSEWCRRIIDSIKVTWSESEGQHLHEE